MNTETKIFHVVNNNNISCGHNHRTLSGAQKCREKLLCWNKKEKTYAAKWYNSKIVLCDENFDYNNGNFCGE